MGLVVVDICAKGMSDVLNSGPNGVVKEASRYNEMWLTYEVAITEGGIKRLYWVLY